MINILNKIKTYYFAVKRIFHDHGIKGFLVIIVHTLEYLKFKFLLKGNFEFNGKLLPYFYHWYGHTYRSERIIEVPIVLDFLNNNNWRNNKTVLEVGDVLSHYTKLNLSNHDIVDKYADDNPDVLNEDVANFQTNKKYDIAVSISTIEHVGWDETPREKNKFLKGINNMLSLLGPEGKMILTVPLGHNSDLDSYLNKGNFEPFRAYFLRRISKNNRWKQIKYDQVGEYAYNKPYPFGNVVMVLIKD